MNKKIIALILTALLCISLFTACSKTTSGQNDGQQTQNSPTGDQQTGEGKKTFIVGLDENFPPMGFRDKNGEITGFDIDLAKEAAQRMGLEIVLQPIDWTAKELELSTGKIDCIWNGLTITDERKKEMAFTKPYLKNTQVIMVLADSDIKTIDDLKDLPVGTQSGSSAYDLLEKDANLKAKFKSVETYPDYESALLDMKSKRISAVLGDSVLLRYKMTQQSGAYRILDDILAEEEYGVGLRKDDTELLNKLQAALDEMNSDGTSAKISEKWFGSDLLLK